MFEWEFDEEQRVWVNRFTGEELDEPPADWAGSWQARRRFPTDSPGAIRAMFEPRISGGRTIAEPSARSQGAHATAGIVETQTVGGSSSSSSSGSVTVPRFSAVSPETAYAHTQIANMLVDQLDIPADSAGDLVDLWAHRVWRGTAEMRMEPVPASELSPQTIAALGGTVDPDTGLLMLPDMGEVVDASGNPILVDDQGRRVTVDAAGNVFDERGFVAKNADGEPLRRRDLQPLREQRKDAAGNPVTRPYMEWTGDWEDGRWPDITDALNDPGLLLAASKIPTGADLLPRYFQVREPDGSITVWDNSPQSGPYPVQITGAFTGQTSAAGRPNPSALPGVVQTMPSGPQDSAELPQSQVPPQEQEKL